MYDTRVESILDDVGKTKCRCRSPATNLIINKNMARFILAVPRLEATCAYCSPFFTFFLKSVVGFTVITLYDMLL